MVRGPLTAWQVDGAAAVGVAAMARPAANAAAAIVEGQCKVPAKRMRKSRRRAASAYSFSVLAWPRPRPGCIAVDCHKLCWEGNLMGIMGIISMIVVGFIVGVLARFFYPGAIGLGFWMTTLLGIGGSLVGGVIGGLIWKSSDGKFNPGGIVLSIIGAMIILWAYLNFMK
jgi:uncharacterized membrane protein YeaQ/YmgE (transglycosylase-associated protein family)